ncbi:MAG: Ig-like domain-containing protein, partial [Myxococcales bacterium]
RAGNAIDPAAASSKLSFTVDGTAPAISRTSPVAGTTVGNSVRVEIAFSEDVQPSTIDAQSITLSFGGNRQPAAVWYDVASRTAVLQPSGRLSDGQQTITLDATRIADLAGNKLASAGSTFTFNVSSSGPSVTSVDPCNSLVDAYDLDTKTIVLTFDRGVKKAGGAGLDGAALRLQRNGSDVPSTVTHTEGTATATIKSTAALEPGSQYTVHATTLVAD